MYQKETQKNFDLFLPNFYKVRSIILYAYVQHHCIHLICRNAEPFACIRNWKWVQDHYLFRGFLGTHKCGAYDLFDERSCFSWSIFQVMMSDALWWMEDVGANCQNSSFDFPLDLLNRVQVLTHHEISEFRITIWTSGLWAFWSSCGAFYNPRHTRAGHESGAGIMI